MNRIVLYALLVSAMLLTTTSSHAQPTARLPTDTFLTKITEHDLLRAGLHIEDARWETLTFRSNGTWRAVWFHPRVAEQPPEVGRDVVTGDRIRLLGTSAPPTL